MRPLGNPLGQGVDPGEGWSGNRREEIEFDDGRASCHEEKSERSAEDKKCGSGIFRSKKAEKDSEDEEKREGARTDFEPEVGGIGMSRDKFPKKVEGNGGERKEAVHNVYNSIGWAGCQSCRTIQRVDGIRSMGISAGRTPGRSRAGIASRRTSSWANEWRSAGVVSDWLIERRREPLGERRGRQARMRGSSSRWMRKARPRPPCANVGGSRIIASKVSPRRANRGSTRRTSSVQKR